MVLQQAITVVPQILSVRDQVDLVGGIRNLFDRAYRIHGSGIDAYGRAAWLATHIRF